MAFGDLAWLGSALQGTGVDLVLREPETARSGQRSVLGRLPTLFGTGGVISGPGPGIGAAKGTEPVVGGGGGISEGIGITEGVGMPEGATIIVSGPVGMTAYEPAVGV